MITKKDIFCGCKCFLVKCDNCRGCKYYLSDVTSLFCFQEADLALRFWILERIQHWILAQRLFESGHNERKKPRKMDSLRVCQRCWRPARTWRISCSHMKAVLPGVPLLPALTCFTNFLSFPWQSLPVGIMGLALARSRRPSPMLVGKAVL